MPRISVIIPCYNGERYIDRSIVSVYNQEYEDIELIVVDDGSTDGSKNKICAWVSLFEKKNWRLRYVYQENLGPGSAINTGLKYVTGEYLTLLDADDYFLPGSFEKRAQFLDENPDYSGVRSNGWASKGKEKKLFVESESEKKETNLFRALFFSATNNWAGTYMVRTDILFAFYPERNIYPSRFGQNMQIILPVAYKRKFGFIDEPLMVYVIHEDSHSRAASAEEQWEKDDRNFYGYLDIYRHMIASVIEDKAEREAYENRVDYWLHRHECERAMRCRDKVGLSRSFKALADTGYMTLNDKIAYYAVLNPARSIAYRVVRRVKILRTGGENLWQKSV